MEYHRVDWVTNEWSDLLSVRASLCDTLSRISEKWRWAKSTGKCN